MRREYKAKKTIKQREDELAAYLEKRLAEARIKGPRQFVGPEGQLSAPYPQLKPARIFRNHSGDGLEILYSDWNGRLYRNPAAAEGAPKYFTRYRVAPWNETPEMKYWQHKGTGAHLYGNAVYWYFVSTGKDVPLIVFCEGEMKAEVLSSYGIPAVAIAGISALAGATQTEAMAMIDQLRPARVLMLYDQDAYANEGRHKRAKNFANSAWKFIQLVEEMGVDGRVLIPTELLAGKGIDDTLNEANRAERRRVLSAITFDRESHYFERYTAQHKRQLFARIMNSTAGPDGFNTFREPNEVANVQKWIGQAEGQITKAVKNHGQVILKAPTGRGKTTAAINIAKAWPSRAVIIAPLTSIVERETYERLDIAPLTGRTNRDNVDAARNAKVVFTTVDQFWKVADTLEADDLIIYDEADYLPRNHDWKSFSKKAEIDRVIRAVHCSTFVLAMTATPPPLVYDEWYWLDVVPRERKVKPELTVIEGKGRVKSSTEQALRFCSAGKVIIRIQSKADLKDLHDALVKSKPELESQIEILTSKDKETSEVYKAIASTGKIPDHCQILLVTGLIDYGLSIANGNVAAMIAVDSHNNKIDAATFRQFVARTRASNFPVQLIAAERDGEPTSAERLYRSLYQDAEAICTSQQAIWDNIQNSMTPLDGDGLPELTGERAQHVYFDEVEGLFKPNPAGIFATVNKEVRKTVSNERLLEDLSADFIIVSKSEAGDESPDVIDARKERKQERKDERAHARELIFEFGPAVIDSEDYPDTEGARFEARRARALKGYSVPELDIPGHLEDCQQPRPWGRLIKQAAYQYGKTQGHDLNVYAKDEIEELTKVEEHFAGRIGEELTGEQVQKAIGELTGRKRSRRKAMELLSILFDLKESRTEQNMYRANKMFILEPLQQIVHSAVKNDTDPYDEVPF